MQEELIYLDHAASTPVRPEVRAAMEPFLAENFGNPSSTHSAGRAARAALEDARERVAAVLGAERREVVFTGGGTEADNLALLGRWRAARETDGSAAGGAALSAIEHSAVRGAAAQAAREGAPVTVLAVDEHGRLDEAALTEALREPLAVVSVMWGNNEVGTLQPVGLVAERCREAGVAFHTDAVQAAGHVPVRVDDVPCDLLALSAHKLGGPKGAGALFIRGGTALEPVLRGGGHELGLRPGTVNVAGAVGLAEALELATEELDAEPDRLGGLRDRLEARLTADIDGLLVHGANAARLPHILNVGLEGAPADVLLPALDLAGLAVSAGSACQSGSAAPSHVLSAMGAIREGARDDAAIRFSLGWTSTLEDIDGAADRLIEVVERLRAGVRT